MYSSYKDSYQPAKYNLNYQTNNKYNRFPPKMSDSRSLVSSYQPISIIDFNLKNNGNNKSNWEYREHLKNNATNIQNEMQRKSFNDVGYYERYIDNISNYSETTKPIIPYFFSSLFDNNQPIGYQNSDMKQIYLTKEQLNARLMSPKISM
jgi:hypothetical protein